MTDLSQPLPTLIRVTEAFASRLPSQRVIDALGKAEPGDFGALMQAQPFRVVAFRALLRDFPERDTTSLWLHAYDVEVEMEPANPTNGKLPTPAPDSVDTGA